MIVIMSNTSFFMVILCIIYTIINLILKIVKYGRRKKYCPKILPDIEHLGFNIPFLVWEVLDNDLSVS